MNCGHISLSSICYTPCSKQENKEQQKLLKDDGVLPEGVFAYVYDSRETLTTEFYTI